MQKLGSTSRICIQAAAEAVPAAAALCRYLKERGMTQTRLAEDSEAGELQVVFSVPEAVSGWEEDQYSVIGSDGCIRIQAVNSAGFFAAAGAVLFGLRFCADGHMEVPQYDLSGAPKMTYRASLLSIHQQDNGYKNWSREQFAAYMEDLALWGANVGMYLVLQFGQRSRKTFEAGTAEAEQWETIRQLPELVGDMGLKVGMYCGHNDVFAEDVQKLRYATDGPAVTMFAASEKSVCPSYPGAAEMIVQRRRELFEKLKRVDALYLPLSDFGGCACEDCQPYVNTYLKVCRGIADCLREVHPQAKVYLSAQMMTREGVLDYLIPYLCGTDSDWVDGIVYGCHGTAVSVPELREKLPAGRYQILAYPEVTMSDNWGRIGAVPWIKHPAYDIEHVFDAGTYCNGVGDWGESSTLTLDSSLPMGYDMDTMYDQLDGAFTYSEGLHDDIAKYTWIRYCWDPTGDRVGFARDYCRLYFGEEAADMALEAVLQMEETSYRRILKAFCPPLTANDNGMGRENSSRVKALTEKMRTMMPVWAVNGWRFKMLELRARMDEAAFRAVEEQIPETEKDALIDLAEEIYEMTGQISIVPAGTPWSREKARELLEKLLYPPKTMELVAPTAPQSDE